MPEVPPELPVKPVHEQNPSHPPKTHPFPSDLDLAKLAAGIHPDWQEALGEALKDPATRETARIASESGILPPRVKPDEDIVRKNADIDDPQKRLQKAADLLGLELEALSAEKQKAIITAHNVSGRGMYEYTPEQIAQKSRILAEAGFTKEECRMLIEAGIAGKNTVRDRSAYDSSAYTDPAA